LLLTEVYAAGEEPIQEADGRTLTRALRRAGFDSLVFAEDIHGLAQVIYENAQDGDVVMCMGAGSIGQVPAQVMSIAQEPFNGLVEKS
jgi:UDP-N-acetylmuramate--alanine ligase